MTYWETLVSVNISYKGCRELVKAQKRDAHPDNRTFYDFAIGSCVGTSPVDNRGYISITGSTLRAPQTDSL